MNYIINQNIKKQTRGKEITKYTWEGTNACNPYKDKTFFCVFNGWPLPLLYTKRYRGITFHNTCGINVISPLYIIQDNKSILVHDKYGFTHLHKIEFLPTWHYTLFPSKVTQSNAPLWWWLGRRKTLWRKMSLDQHSPLMIKLFYMLISLQIIEPQSVIFNILITHVW